MLVVTTHVRVHQQPGPLGEKTVIKENMVLTIEPAMEYAPGKMIVHEENIIIQQDGAELITKRAPKEIPVIK